MELKKMKIETKNETPLIKKYQITAALVTYYSKEIEFDSSDADIWYQYDEEAQVKNLCWEDLSSKRQNRILQAFIEDLQNESIEPESDPDVFEDSFDWEHEIRVIEL
jgi:hypothetical protein